MKLDNSPRASKIRLLFMLIPFLTLLVVGLAYLFFKVRSSNILYYSFLCIVIYVIIMIVCKYNFISFYAGPDKVNIKYKNLSPTLNTNNSVAIKIENFHKFEIKKRFFGVFNTLYLYQKTDDIVAKFPPISLSALNDFEVQQIRKALDFIVALNSHRK